jgi:tRNA-specific adenosine deaminase 1
MLLHDSTALSNVVEARPVTQVTRRSPQPFVIKQDVNIHMYCSEAPCGDASMELIMQAQEDPTPWQLPELASDVLSDGVDETSLELKGRGFFSELGIVRRKPGANLLQVVPTDSHND